MYQLSLYTHLFRDSEKYYVYNSQSNFFSEISSDFYALLKDREWSQIPAEIIDQARAQKIIVPKGQEFDYYNSQLLRFNLKNFGSRTLGLVIAPTTNCNFKCPYCFEPKKNPKTISAPTIDELRTFIKSFKDIDKLSLTWYGGEPLLALEKIEKILSMLQEEGMPEIVSQSIITNGYLFNEKAIEVFKQPKLNSIQITLDGVAERHNSTRSLKNGKPTFDVIVDNIDKLLSTFPKTSLSIRVNIDKNNYSDFSILYDYFKKKYPDNKMLSVYPGLIRVETTDGKSLKSSCFNTSEIIELDNLIEKSGIAKVRFPRKENRGCMANSLYSYIVGPEGELYKCWNDVSDTSLAVGHISKPELVGGNRLLTFMMEAIPFNTECKKCSVFPICEGGCAYHRLRNLKEGANYSVCSPYKDFETLKRTLLSGCKPEIV